MKNPDFFYVVLGRVLSSGLQATFYFIFALMLTPEEYGNLSFLIAIAGVAATISRFGLNQTIVVFQAKNSSFANQLNFLALISTSIAAIILLSVDIFAAFLTLASSIFLMNIQNMLGLKKYKKYGLLNLIKGLLMIIFPIIGFQFLEIEGILLGMSLGYIVTSIHFFKYLSFKNNLRSQIRYNSKTIIHNFGVDISINLVRFVDKLVIVPIVGFAVLGIYQLNLQILIGLEILPTALHSYLLSEESSGKKHKKITFLAILFSILLVIATIFFSPYLIPQLFPNYIEGINSLMVLVFSIMPLTLSSILNAKLQAIESTKIGFSAIVRIGSLVILIIILGSAYGLMGLSYSVLISSSLYAIFLAFIFKIESRKKT